MGLIPRESLKNRLLEALRRSPCVALLGPRQCGKTTLAKQVVRDNANEYLDLDDPTTQARLANPKMVLRRMQGLVVIDEVQRRPDLFGLLRVLLDRDNSPARFLILGSASPDIVRGVSESLAGRVEFVMMAGFVGDEVGFDALDTFWLRGGFPRSFLAASDDDSWAWRRNFVETFLERDLRAIGFNMAPEMMRRFFTMLAHSHGGVWNSSDIASSIQIAHTTARRYLDLLTGTYVIRQLPPWFENVGKRVVKSPKVYVRDSGLLHTLLGIRTLAELQSHPKLGASWEGLALEEVLRIADEREAYFWATYGGAELDLLLVHGATRLGFEFKATDTPRTTKSMRIASRDLRLTHLYIVFPGDQSFPIDDEISTLALRDVPSQIRAVGRV